MKHQQRTVYAPFVWGLSAVLTMVIVSVIALAIYDRLLKRQIVSYMMARAGGR